MDRVSPELWAMIFEHACTDSGVTGRQLSLVSKFIREAAAPAKLQSIAVHGRRKIIAFHQLLLQTPPHLRHIRYLCLSTAPDRPTSSEEEAQVRNACQGVLAAVAEYVQIMYLDVGEDYLQDFPITPFPRLAELASNGFPMLPPDYPLDSDGPNTTPCSPCPQLRRWHLMELPWMLSGQGGVATICATAPALTHLRFSDLQQESDFAYNLEDGLPGTIQHVYVKPAGPPAPGGWCGTPRIAYGSLMSGLKRLNLTDSRLVLLPAYKADETAGTFIMGEWEERVNGGDGCWSLRERVLTGIDCGET
ncbi:hypothetical protein FIBSPDRAFT_868685, partial [Athelia psychrophila]